MNKIQQLIKEYKENRTEENLRALITEIQNCEVIWAAYSPVTKNHFVDYVQGMPTAFLFSEKEYCEDFCKHMKKSGMTVGFAKCTKENRLPMFSDFYRSGFEGIIIDNGKNYQFIEMYKVVTPPDYSEVPEEKRPLFNPSLVCSADRFFQCLENKSISPDKELNMLVDTYNAKYLVPMTCEPQNGQITIPALERSDGKKVVPFFTDINEYRKYDGKNRYRITIAGFEQINELCSAGETVVINPLGFNFNLTKDTCAAIERAHNTVAGADQNDRAVIYTPDDIPMTLINELCGVFDNCAGVNAAYIKGLRKKGTSGLLVVLDCGDVSKEEAAKIVEKAAAKAEKITGERPMEYIPADSDIGRIATKDTPPFFQHIIVDASAEPDNYQF